MQIGRTNVSFCSKEIGQDLEKKCDIIIKLFADPKSANTVEEKLSLVNNTFGAEFDEEIDKYINAANKRQIKEGKSMLDSQDVGAGKILLTLFNKVLGEKSEKRQNQESEIINILGKHDAAVAKLYTEA